MYFVHSKAEFVSILLQELIISKPQCNFRKIFFAFSFDRPETHPGFKHFQGLPMETETDFFPYQPLRSLDFTPTRFAPDYECVSYCQANLLFILRITRAKIKQRTWVRLLTALSERVYSIYVFNIKTVIFELFCKINSIIQILNKNFHEKKYIQFHLMTYLETEVFIVGILCRKHMVPPPPWRDLIRANSQ